jgi:hypothetical protein
VWTLFGLAAGASLCFSSLQLPGWPGVLLPLTVAAVALALVCLPALAVLGATGPFGVRHVEWAADGKWCLTRPDGRRETGRLTRATMTLGPWILLAWTVGSGARPRRRYALMGAAEAGPETYRALKGRLTLAGSRQSTHAPSLPGPVAP